MFKCVAPANIARYYLSLYCLCLRRCYSHAILYLYTLLMYYPGRQISTHGRIATKPSVVKVCCPSRQYNTVLFESTLPGLLGCYSHAVLYAYVLPWETDQHIWEVSYLVSLAGAATSIIFVATKRLSRQTHILSR